MPRCVPGRWRTAATARSTRFWRGVAASAARTPHRVRKAERRPLPYGVLRDGQGELGVIEAASVVGITDRDGMHAPVHARSTRGMGEIMRALMDRGIRRFMVGLGGSSTNDGGAGLLAALGAQLLDEHGAAVEPTPQGLTRLARVDASTIDPRIRECSITVLSDVDNPLTGPRGATAVFGPQKGVGAEEVKSIDATLAHFGACAEQAFGKSVAALPGAGAAGGLGFALLLLGASAAARRGSGRRSDRPRWCPGGGRLADHR